MPNVTMGETTYSIPDDVEIKELDATEKLNDCSGNACGAITFEYDSKRVGYTISNSGDKRVRLKINEYIGGLGCGGVYAEVHVNAGSSTFWAARGHCKYEANYE